MGDGGAEGQGPVRVAAGLEEARGPDWDTGSPAAARPGRTGSVTSGRHPPHAHTRQEGLLSGPASAPKPGHGHGGSEVRGHALTVSLRPAPSSPGQFAPGARQGHVAQLGTRWRSRAALSTEPSLTDADLLPLGPRQAHGLAVQPGQQPPRP